MTKKRLQDILESFLPAMEKIQEMKVSDDEKKRAAKEWLRAKLDVFGSKDELTREKSTNSND